MNYEAIKKGLSDFNQDEVLVYLNYLKHLETDKDRDQQLRNKWFQYFKPEQAIDLYKKVSIDNMYIDGDTITLQFKGKVMLSYNYQAYKNKLLNVYPETLFDIQIVCKGDSFSFKKESGKIIYYHDINDPFATDREIIGTYCIIKNSRGEFLETLNMSDINKMKAAAKTKAIWDAWFSEMVLKSVIKRACKRHFKDVTNNMDSIDNELSDPERITIDEAIQKRINDAKTEAELTNIYKSEKNNISDKVKFIQLLGERKKEIQNENL